jgi:hypothetical protein
MITAGSRRCSPSCRLARCAVALASKPLDLWPARPCIGRTDVNSAATVCQHRKRHRPPATESPCSDVGSGGSGMVGGSSPIAAFPAGRGVHKQRGAGGRRRGTLKGIKGDFGNLAEVESVERRILCRQLTICFLAIRADHLQRPTPLHRESAANPSNTRLIVNCQLRRNREKVSL